MNIKKTSISGNFLHPPMMVSRTYQVFMGCLPTLQSLEVGVTVRYDVISHSYFSVNGGKPDFPTKIQETTHKSIHLYLSYRVPPSPALCTASIKTTTLTHRINYSICKRLDRPIARYQNILKKIHLQINHIKTQKGPSSKGRGTRGTTLISLNKLTLRHSLEYLSLVTMR